MSNELITELDIGSYRSNIIEDLRLKKSTAIKNSVKTPIWIVKIKKAISLEQKKNTELRLTRKRNAVTNNN